MFERILIANRGEIACRIVRTAHRLGVSTVAVYSDADAGARHVGLADEAYPIGPAPAAESYLRGDVIIDIARHAGAQAIHPGYGFLSENADFADACAAADIAFVGAPAEAIRAMGAKDRAKAIMLRDGIPVVPGYHQSNLDLKILTTEARRIGYPVLVKAVAGGGGRGMRVAGRELDLAQAIAAARREAKSAFGDDRIMIEKLVATPRHVEVQVFADAHGNVVHLFERDCSIQRRYQKVIEEAPSPGLSPERRRTLGETAVAAARSIGYVGAGTVEFIVDGRGKHYFMEMNTRLQVEHPVTEMVTGLDLVEWQLRVAAGEPLPLAQDQITLAGHAVEARLYAEDPARGFMPSTGRLARLRMPAGADDVEPGARVPLRIDSGIGEGDVVTPYYDSMIAKFVSWGRDRSAAIGTLRRALADTHIVGPATNISFLIAVTGHADFAANDFDTGFIAKHSDTLLRAPDAAPGYVLAIGVVYLLLHRGRRAAADAARSTDPHSPWAAGNSWRLNDDAQDVVTLIDGETPVRIAARWVRDGFRLSMPDGELVASGRLESDGRLRANIGGVGISASVVLQPTAKGGVLDIVTLDARHRLAVADPLTVTGEADAEGGRLTAPMPGKITQILTESGACVARGAPLLVIEAMKVEHTISAPAGGRIEKVKYAVGDWVDEGAILVDFHATD